MTWLTILEKYLYPEIVLFPLKRKFQGLPESICAIVYFKLHFRSLYSLQTPRVSDIVHFLSRLLSRWCIMLILVFTLCQAVVRVGLWHQSPCLHENTSVTNIISINQGCGIERWRRVDRAGCDDLKWNLQVRVSCWKVHGESNQVSFKNENYPVPIKLYNIMQCN